MVKVQPNTSFVFKKFRYYLQNGAVFIMGYLKISWATSIFLQVALLATMCFCLISTPDYRLQCNKKYARKNTQRISAFLYEKMGIILESRKHLDGFLYSTNEMSKGNDEMKARNQRQNR